MIKDGEIVERGVHTDLVRAGGVYTELYETQFRRALDTDYENEDLPEFYAAAHESED